MVPCPHSSIGSSILLPHSWHSSDNKEEEGGGGHSSIEEFVEEECDDTTDDDDEVVEAMEDDEQGETWNLLGEVDEDNYSTTEHKEGMIDVE